MCSGCDTDASRILSNPERAAYRVVLQVTQGQMPAQHIWRGHLSLASDWEPPALGVLRSVLYPLELKMPGCWAVWETGLRR